MRSFKLKLVQLAKIEGLVSYVTDSTPAPNESTPVFNWRGVEGQAHHSRMSKAVVGPKYWLHMDFSVTKKIISKYRYVSFFWNRQIRKYCHMKRNRVNDSFQVSWMEFETVSAYDIFLVTRLCSMNMNLEYWKCLLENMIYVW